MFWSVYLCLFHVLLGEITVLVLDVCKNFAHDTFKSGFTNVLVMDVFSVHVCWLLISNLQL